MKRRNLLASLLLVAACSGGGGKKQPVTGGGGDTGGGDTSGGDTGGGDTRPADPHLPTRQAFQNPGGMWMPRQMLDHADRLAGLGMEIDAAQLSDPTKAPLAAVVSLGGCTASFVSPEGLIITNHHCVQGALQLNATPEDNIVENGFLAKTRADERTAGPGQRVMVAQKISDVTAAVREGLDGISDAKKRYEELEKRQKELTAACEKDRPGVKCSISGFFKGSEYQQIEYLELRDVRLVYVPHRAVGNYGGEIDNWAWPRHTSDFSFYRAYVGKDGKPADYSTDNVPFQPAAFLKVQPAGVAANDLVFVTGYPGVTRRQQTAAEMTRAMEWTHPRYIEKANQKMELLAALQQTGGETAIKAGVARQNVQNGLEKYAGILEGLQNSDLVARKVAEEKAFREWSAADPARKKYSDALDAIQAKFAEAWANDTREEAFRDVAGGSSLLGTAVFLVRWSEEQQKKDADRKPGYQERDRARILAGQKTFAKRFDRNIDRAFLKMMLLRAAAAAPADRAFLYGFLGVKKNAKIDDKLIDKTLDAWYSATKLEDEKVRMALLASKPKKLKASKDPFVKLAVAITPTLRKIEQRDEAWYGDMVLLNPTYMEGMMAFKGGMIAPDANGTLRVSYGTVRGYKPAADKPVYEPFTTASQILGKNTGEEPFDMPQGVLDAIRAAKWGPYAAANLDDVPVCFLSDLDITGGNSGSPVLNGRGELVGLAFDGNYEGLASDVVFKGETTRTITADIRMVLWLADAVDGADHLLTEMGVKPSL